MRLHWRIDTGFAQLMAANETNSTSDHIWTNQDKLQSRLPPRLRLLCVGPQEPSWVSIMLQLDAEGCLEPQFRWVSSSNEALTLLRDESFDCVLISDALSPTAGLTSSIPSECDGDALRLLRAIRASGCDEPIVLVASSINDERWTELCHKDCELLVTPNLWESLALVPMIKRAVSRVEQSREHRRLATANHRRLVRERDEAEHLLKQQRQIIQELEILARPASEQTEFATIQTDGYPSLSTASQADTPQSRIQLPNEINGYYHELLRTYVIMGSGNLGSEIAKLAELLVVAGVSPREALQLHLKRVESLVGGLGNRSTRHVMARADLLALELMIHLGECCQRKLLSAQTNSPNAPATCEVDLAIHAETA